MSVSISDKVTITVSDHWRFSAAETEAIQQSLSDNGIAIIRNFVSHDDLAALQMSARTATEKNFAYGKENGCTVATVSSAATQEFRHPFLVSDRAAKLVTSPALLDLIEGVLDDKATIHHALFQRSIPTERVLLDWHIDMGSNKLLNGPTKFDDIRVRMIIYLSDVSNGGFSYIVNSSEDALRTFSPMPIGELFPPEKVPADPARRLTVNGPAGTIVLFNTHGLHRPEAPLTERLVLNTWFARSDFAGKLPSTLASLGLVPPDQRHRSYVFANERGFSSLESGVGAHRTPTFPERVVSKLVRLAG
jgi:hypothetical protein